MAALLTALRFLGLGLTGGLGALQALMFSGLIVAAAAGGGYVWGRVDGYAINQVAAIQARVAYLEGELDVAQRVAEEARQLADNARKTEDKEDDVSRKSEELAGKAAPAGVCATADFLRSLDSGR